MGRIVRGTCAPQVSKPGPKDNKGVRWCGTEAHAPRWKSRASISTPHRLQILCQIEPRGREGRGTGAEIPARKDGDGIRRGGGGLVSRLRLCPTRASAADATCPSSRPSRCSPLILQRFLQGDSGQGAHHDCRLMAETCKAGTGCNRHPDEEEDRGNYLFFWCCLSGSVRAVVD